VLDGVARHLSVDPKVETRRRKPMRPNPLAPWELRLGSLRAYSDIATEPEPLAWTDAHTAFASSAIGADHPDARAARELSGRAALVEITPPRPPGSC
jgi:hypothetical protein